jgi:hypothetical protein
MWMSTVLEGGVKLLMNFAVIIDYLSRQPELIMTRAIHGYKPWRICDRYMGQFVGGLRGKQNQCLHASFQLLE